MGAEIEQIYADADCTCGLCEVWEYHPSLGQSREEIRR
jgi:hypothetical protein